MGKYLRATIKGFSEYNKLGAEIATPIRQSIGTKRKIRIVKTTFFRSGLRNSLTFIRNTIYNQASSFLIFSLQP